MAFPTIAERARTTAASAAAADLITYAPRPGGPSSVTVPVDADHRGRPLLSVGANSPAAARLLARPLATVILAAPACAPVVVHGGAHRVRGARRHRVLAFRLEVAGVRRSWVAAKGRWSGPTSTRPQNPIRCATPRPGCSRTWPARIPRNSGPASAPMDCPASSSSSRAAWTGTGWSCWRSVSAAQRRSGCPSRRR